MAREPVTLLRTLSIVAAFLAIASQACEPTAPDSTPSARPEPPPEAAKWTRVHIEDDPDNSTLVPCGSGGMRAPGADIDAAAMFDGDPNSGGKKLAGLIDCTTSSPMICANDAAQAASAEGEPDASEQAGFVSLNGGCVSCKWSGEIDARPGDYIEVYSIGGSSGGSAERYRVRMENASGKKSLPSDYGSGELAVEVGGLIQ